MLRSKRSKSKPVEDFFDERGPGGRGANSTKEITMYRTVSSLRARIT